MSLPSMLHALTIPYFLFDHSNNIWKGISFMRFSLCKYLYSLISASLLGVNNLLSILVSITLNLCSSLNMRDHVSHPYITGGRIIALYFLIYVSRQQTRGQKVLKCIEASINWIYLNLACNKINNSCKLCAYPGFHWNVKGMIRNVL
jgi:hypothetical protein